MPRVRTIQTTPRKMALLDNRKKAVDMRRAGASFQQIGDALGCCFQNAFRMVKEEMMLRIAETQEAAEEIRQMEVERLDAMFLPQYRMAIQGDEKACRAALSIMERRARLLGLDAPSKIAPTDPSGDNPYKTMTDEEAIAIVTAAAGKLG